MAASSSEVAPAIDQEEANIHQEQARQARYLTSIRRNSLCSSNKRVGNLILTFYVFGHHRQTKSKLLQHQGI